jgi:hypothetical protein
MKTFKCICCEKEIDSLWFESLSPDNPEQGAWEGGVVELLNMPYGSRLDTETFIFGICDDCIEDKYKKGLIGKKIIKKDY